MSPPALRVLSYNVRSLRDDRHAVAAVIRACAPDVACIQEAPRFLRSRASCAALARESELHYVVGGRTAGDCLLLARADLDAVDPRAVLLSRTPGLHRRGVALATFAGVVVASVHLGLEPAERRRHVAEVFVLLAREGRPAVLAGDINEQPGEPAWQAIAERLRDVGPVGRPTFPAREPRRRIDAIFAHPGLTVMSSELPDLPGVERASDHRPVLAALAAQLMNP